MSSSPIALFPITENCCLQPIPSKVEFVLPVFSYFVELDEWVMKAKRGDILVQGYPHNTSYYQASKNWLARELTPRDGEYTRASERDLVAHIRLGDLFAPQWVEMCGYPADVFARLLGTLDYDRCLIVTDSPDSPVINDLIQHHRGVLVSKTVEHDYRTLYNASRLIMSPSTFSWWAAWTGAAAEIYQPYEMGYWRKECQFALDLPGAHVKRFDAHGQVLSAGT